MGENYDNDAGGSALTGRLTPGLLKMIRGRIRQSGMASPEDVASLLFEVDQAWQEITALTAMLQDTRARLAVARSR